MNNNQFRKLVFDTPARQKDGSPTSRSGAASSAFGAKKSSFMPMTPRTVKGGVDVDFARQVRERNAALQPTKKFKSSAAPKGAKYAKGYTDRTRAREEAGDAEDEKAARIKALEEQMKLGQITVEVFEGLRDQITGGDASSTYLVKGLDRKLLERVKRGEDVLGIGGGDKTSEPASDVDEELDKLGEKEFGAVRRESVKKGMMAAPPIAGKKRSRDEIMAELRAQRKAAARAKAAPLLDARWRKVGEKEKSRIEIDHKGREVLITVDEDGVVKKKMRKAVAQDEEATRAAVDMPDANRPVLGADAVVPEQVPQPGPVEEEEEDIFEGVGTEYNPLGDAMDESDGSDEESDDGETTAPQSPSNPTDDRGTPDPGIPSSDDEDPTDTVPEPVEQGTIPEPMRRSYFKDPAKSTEEAKADHFAGIQNVLKKAAQLDQTKPATAHSDEARDGETEEAHQARLKRRAQMLAQQDRDLEDMDLGFGSRRFEDEAEAEGEGGKEVKLSEWKQGAGADEEDDDGKNAREKKKRKRKKRTGDVNNAADIMRVIEGRKAGGK